MKIKTIISAFLVFSSPLIAATRTWTATDGRIIRGRFVALTDTSVKILRTDTNKTVMVPLSMLSAPDRDVARAERTKQAENAKALEDLIRSVPVQKPIPFVSIDISKNNDCVQLYSKYKDTIRFFHAETLKDDLKNVRRSIADDIDVVREHAVTKTSPGMPNYDATLAARVNLNWLSFDLPAYLSKIEDLKP